tara:strand:- start:940 stop:1557 length:618 start_codon:yes stop_codon:yes gene_type:complete
MIEYFIPLLILCIVQSGTPGPNNIMLTASGKNFGYIKSIPHMLGVVLGFLSLIIVFGLGLTVIFSKYPIIQFVLRIVGSIYLLYLSYRIYSSVNTEDLSKSKPITFMESSLFQYVNPKGVMMAITTISIYTDHINFKFISSFNEGMIYILIAFTISNIIAVITWTSVGVFIGQFIKSARGIKIFNALMAFLLVLTIIWINLDLAS